MDSLDPARTALLVVHMAKGVAGQVDTSFNRLFRQRAEKTGSSGSRDGCWTSSAGPRRRWSTPWSHTRRPESARTPHCFVRSSKVPPYWRALLPSRSSTTSAPRPDEPVVRGQAANGYDGTALGTILRVAGVDTLVLVGIATDVAVESTARAASDLQYRTIVVSDACQADSDEAHARALEVLQKWFGETPTAEEVLSALRTKDHDQSVPNLSIQRTRKGE